MSDAGRVTLRRDGPVAHVLFDRPAARNAMTWAMYDGLATACETLAAGDAAVAVLRGAGGRAFVAGTDIAQFAAFSTGDDGIAYERRIEEHMARLSSLPLPTVAAVEGWAVGGGLAIAACCDIRIATEGSRFGVPIARTVGNCLSSATLARLTACFGMERTRRMLMLGEMIDADEALAAGFLSRVVPRETFEAEIASIAGTLAAHAPVTLRVTKEALARLERGDRADADLIARAYGSEDFRRGIRAFMDKEIPRWTGR